MADKFKYSQPGLDSPLTHSELADYSAQDHEFSNTTRSILVTSAGDVVMRLMGDVADLTLTVEAGFSKPYRVTHIRMASTANVVGFW